MNLAPTLGGILAMTAAVCFLLAAVKIRYRAPHLGFIIAGGAAMAAAVATFAFVTASEEPDASRVGIGIDHRVDAFVLDGRVNTGDVISAAQVRLRTSALPL
jgi:hypothetical protein